MLEGLPVSILGKYGVEVFLVVCMSGFLWYLIKQLGKQTDTFTKHITSERVRWEVIVDNHFQDLAKTNRETSEILSSVSGALSQIRTNLTADGERSRTLFTTQYETLKRDQDLATKEHEKAALEHEKAALEHARMLERIKRSNGSD